MAQSKINKIRGNGSWTGEYGTFYTFEYEFEDGTIIKNVANRIVEFPSHIKHRGVSQTDTKTRILMNINYLKAKPKVEIR